MIPATAILALAGAFCGWVYWRREFAVRGRLLLALARVLAVAAVASVLWNPDVSVGGAAGPARWAILDASPSMAAIDQEGAPVEATARERVQALAAAGARVLAAGDGADGRSRLAGAVATAAEAGAREIVLVTDRRLADPVATAAAARRLEVGLTVDSGVAVAAPNVGIGRFDLPRTVAPGQPLEGRVEIEGWIGGVLSANGSRPEGAGQARGAAGQGAGVSPPSGSRPEGAAGDSGTVAVVSAVAGPPAAAVAVVIAVDRSPRRTLQLPMPADGRASSAAFVLEDLPPGARRVEARLQRPDAFPLDDRRVRIVHVGSEEPGVLLASFAPGWEARFLLPVLAQATGLPARGWVRTGPDRFQPMTGGRTPPGDPLDEAGLARLMGRAEVVVALGVDGAARQYLGRAAARAQRILVFPATGAGAEAAGVAAGDPLEGEWYVSGAPPSPVAGELGGFALGRLPPLSGVMPLLAEHGGVALEARRGGAGTPRPALVLRDEGGQRSAVALAGGFWRWAFRDGEPVEGYRRLWAAVAGWLIAEDRSRGGAGVRPAGTVFSQGAPLPWRARGHEGREVRVAVVDSTGASVLDSVLLVPASGAFATPPLPPGPYRFHAEAEDTTAGVFEVESYSGDMLRRPVAASELTVPLAPDRAAGAGKRPLRTLPWPYLVALTALCCEWTGRRRAGLR